MRVTPTGHPYSVSNEWTVTDERGIEQIIGLLADAWPIRPNHPISRWECRLEIKTNAETWAMKLVDTERQGLLAYVTSGQTLSSKELHALRELLETTKTPQPNKTRIPNPITPRVD